MRGDSSSGQWRILRVIDTRKQSATVAELVAEEGYPTRTVWGDLSASRTGVVLMDSETAAQETTWGFVHAIQPFKGRLQTYGKVVRCGVWDEGLMLNGRRRKVDKIILSPKS